MWGGTEGGGGGRELGRGEQGRMAFRWFVPSNVERSVSQTHSGLVPVWNVRPHIHTSMAVTVGQSVGGLVGSWVHGVRLSVSVCCHNHDTTRVNTKEKTKRPYCPNCSLVQKWTLLWLKIKKVLQNYISLNRFFLSSHFYTKFISFTNILFLYFWSCGDKNSVWHERKQPLLKAFQLKQKKSYWLTCFHKHKCSLSASNRC